MPEPNQPTAVLVAIVDQAGNAQVMFRRWDATSGRQLLHGTSEHTGIIATLGRIEDCLATAFTTPLKLSSRPSSTAEANTRTLPCGCVISTTGSAPMRECESHKAARRDRDPDQKERATR